MAAVEVESLTITYGSVTAVDDLSFRAEAGEVTCVLGPNGAGKTSTVEALEGLRRPTAGRLSVVGLDPRRDHAALTSRIGVMLQEGGIHPAVRVGEALRHAAALYPDPVDPRSLVDQNGNLIEIGPDPGPPLTPDQLREMQERGVHPGTTPTTVGGGPATAPTTVPTTVPPATPTPPTTVPSS